jgi:hypothetical protein
MRLLLLGILAAAGLTVRVDPLADVQEIAGAIERNYFDAQRAAAIAGDLRNDASPGVFDRFADRRDLVPA